MNNFPCLNTTSAIFSFLKLQPHQSLGKVFLEGVQGELRAFQLMLSS